jgi:pilus assembly protein CpaB
MNNKRILTASIIAAIVAVAAVNIYVGSIRSEYTSGPVVVLQATHDIPEGQPVTAKDYRTVTLPKNLFASVVSYAVTEKDLPVLASTPLRHPLKTGDIIAYSHLSRTVQETLRDTIPPGRRAVSIPVSEEGSVSNFVQPGDLVDIIATLITKEQAVTKAILTNVRVLAVGGEYGENSVPRAGQRGRYGTVTLEVTMEQAERLIFARDQMRAAMTLLLRNPKDQGPPEATPALNGADLISR